MKVAVFIENRNESVRVANDVSRYFYRRRPEYYSKIVNYSGFGEFDAAPGSYGMDLYILELKRCADGDPGYQIAMRLREDSANCGIAFIVPSEAAAVQATREMLNPVYIFVKNAPADEIDVFLDRFLMQAGNFQFIEFTFQYKKWLVNIENIIYIQTCAARLLLVCANATLETTERLTDLERRLPPYFFRVDKGCVINTRRLSAADFTEHKAMFAQAGFVYMSRRGSKRLYDFLNGRAPPCDEKELA